MTDMYAGGRSLARLVLFRVRLSVCFDVCSLNDQRK